MSDTTCPCGSGQSYAECCQPLHQGLPAVSAEQLMRSRYAAYVLGDIDYLRATTLPAQQPGLDLPAIRQWSEQSHWLGLEVQEHAEQGERATVTFIARWNAPGEPPQQHRECSSFARLDGRWYFIDPTVPLSLERNAPCPCRSGRKFKKCCGRAF